jgi:hypothetical protein
MTEDKTRSVCETNGRSASRNKTKPLAELKMSEIMPLLSDGGERERELNLIHKKMKELGIVGIVEPSKRKDKRWRIITMVDYKGSPKKYTINFGDPNRENFLVHKDEDRRQRFLNRFKNAKNKDDPTKGIYYSIRLLW